MRLKRSLPKQKRTFPAQFRVWDRKDRRYLPDYLTLICTQSGEFYSAYDEEWDYLRPEDYIVEWFTGRYDILDNPIYENDIVLDMSTNHGDTFKYRVIYDRCHRGFCARRIDNGVIHSKDNFFLHLWVIGNLHEYRRNKHEQ